MTRTVLGISLIAFLAVPALYAQVEAREELTVATRLAGSSRIVIPQSGIQREEEIGYQSRTLYKIFVPAGRPDGVVGFSE